MINCIRQTKSESKIFIVLVLENRINLQCIIIWSLYCSIICLKGQCIKVENTILSGSVPIEPALAQAAESGQDYSSTFNTSEAAQR